MTQKDAEDKFNHTKDFEQYIIDSLNVYKEQLARNKKITEKQYHFMNNAISGCCIVVKECFKKPE